MSAKWAKNEVDAAKRRCGLIIKYLDANGMISLAPPWLDFMAAGAVFVCGVGSPDFRLATGTVTNQLRPLSVADFTITATDTVNDRVTKVAHTLETGDGPFRPTTTAGGLSNATSYHAIKVDNDQVSWATSRANAYAGVKVDITANVTGMIFQKTVDTARGMWGHFIYTATQAETLHDAPEMIIMVDGIVSGYDCRRMIDGAGAYTTVMMESNAASLLASLLEGPHTVGDALRAVLRTHAAPFVDVGNTRTFKSMDGTKDSHSGTVTGSGRTTNIHDLT